MYKKSMNSFNYCECNKEQEKVRKNDVKLKKYLDRFYNQFKRMLSIFQMYVAEELYYSNFINIKQEYQYLESLHVIEKLDELNLNDFLKYMIKNCVKTKGKLSCTVERKDFSYIFKFQFFPKDRCICETN